MPTDQTTTAVPSMPFDMTRTDPAAGAQGARRRRRRPRLRWASAALVIVGVLGLAGVGCTPEDVATIAISNAFEPAQRDCAKRIVKRESNYQADAVSPGGANIGLFQINRVHTTWIRNTYGYAFAELTDATKNAKVARGLSDAAQAYYGDRWQPWRYGGQVIRGGGCPA